MLNISISPPFLLPALIFLLRVTDMTLDTLRVLFVLRGRRTPAWTLAFVQSGIWVVAITTVLGNLGNPLNLVAYAAGFATGNVVGMTIEARLGIGHSNMRVISRGHGRAAADLMRGLGHALTELPGWGKDGTVSVIECSVCRREVPALR